MNERNNPNCNKNKIGLKTKVDRFIHSFDVFDEYGEVIGNKLNVPLVFVIVAIIFVGLVIISASPMMASTSNSTQSETLASLIVDGNRNSVIQECEVVSKEPISYVGLLHYYSLGIKFNGHFKAFTVQRGEYMSSTVGGKYYLLIRPDGRILGHGSDLRIIQDKYTQSISPEYSDKTSVSAKSFFDISNN